MVRLRCRAMGCGLGRARCESAGAASRAWVGCVGSWWSWRERCCWSRYGYAEGEVVCDEGSAAVERRTALGRNPVVNTGSGRLLNRPGSGKLQVVVCTTGVFGASGGRIVLPAARTRSWLLRLVKCRSKCGCDTHDDLLRRNCLSS